MPSTQKPHMGQWQVGGEVGGVGARGGVGWWCLAGSTGVHSDIHSAHQDLCYSEGLQFYCCYFVLQDKISLL